MGEYRFQFRLSDLLALFSTCGFLAATIANPDSTWLAFLAVGSFVWAAWQLRHADRRIPTRSEAYRLLWIFAGVTFGATLLCGLIIYIILKSSKP